MRIYKKQVICEVPILKIRDFFKHFSLNNKFKKETLCRSLEIDEQKGEELIKELIVQEYIVAVNNSFKIIEKGYSLRVARCVSPLNRQKGEKILNEFLERVRAINADDNLAHYINKVYLFGSFLDKERNDYGDIDLGIEIKPKTYKDDDEYEKKCLEIADQSGRHFSSYLDRVFYAEKLILKKFKNRNQYLSFHTLQDKVFEVTEKREIYSFKK